MAYFGKKIYGESKITPCPICGESAFVRNKDGVPVCKEHKDTKLPAMKCACGTIVDIKVGKYGAYAQCFRCGNVNLNKILEFNGIGK